MIILHCIGISIQSHQDQNTWCERKVTAGAHRNSLHFFNTNHIYTLRSLKVIRTTYLIPTSKTYAPFHCVRTGGRLEQMNCHRSLKRLQSSSSACGAEVWCLWSSGESPGLKERAFLLHNPAAASEPLPAHKQPLAPSLTTHHQTVRPGTKKRARQTRPHRNCLYYSRSTNSGLRRVQSVAGDEAFRAYRRVGSFDSLR